MCGDLRFLAFVGVLEPSELSSDAVQWKLNLRPVCPAEEVDSEFKEASGHRGPISVDQFALTLGLQKVMSLDLILEPSAPLKAAATALAPCVPCWILRVLQ